MYEKRDCYWIFETDGEVVGFCSQFRFKYVEVYFAFSSVRGIVSILLFLLQTKSIKLRNQAQLSKQ